MTTFTREDFEMAAKAAGVPRNRWDYEYCRSHGHMVTPSMMWNPPDDDGEALRLAVLLKMKLHLDEAPHVKAETSLDGVWITNLSDPFEATRHAIFRAAIAIGKAMTAPDARPNQSDASQSPSAAAPKQQTTTLFHPNEMPDSHDPI